MDRFRLADTSCLVQRRPGCPAITDVKWKTGQQRPYRGVASIYSSSRQEPLAGVRVHALQVCQLAIVVQRYEQHVAELA